MAAKNRRSQRKHLKSGGSYSSEELCPLTMEDGTRVVYSADGDIKCPVCAGIDVHKEILMAAVCMESTGKYWIPVFHILEQNDFRRGILCPFAPYKFYKAFILTVHSALQRGVRHRE